jgi:hypothetical protein
VSLVPQANDRVVPQNRPQPFSSISSQNDHSFINLPFDAVYSVLISWKKTCEKTTTEMGRHQEGLFVAANIRGWLSGG